MALYLWFTEQYRAVQSYCTELQCKVQSTVQSSSELQSYWNAFIIVAKQSSAEVHILS